MSGNPILDSEFFNNFFEPVQDGTQYEFGGSGPTDRLGRRSASFPKNLDEWSINRQAFWAITENRTAKPFEGCANSGRSPIGFGPNCDFQDTGRGKEFECLVKARLQAAETYTKSVQGVTTARGPDNCFPTTGLSFTAGGLASGAVDADTAAPSSSQQLGSSVEFETVNGTLNGCEGTSGQAAGEPLRETLDKALEEAEEDCVCRQCSAAEPTESEMPSASAAGRPEPGASFISPTSSDNPAISPPVLPPTKSERQPKMVSSWSGPIPWIVGRVTLRGNAIWAGNPRVVTTTSDGKIVGVIDILVALCSSEVSGLSRVWINGTVIYQGALPPLDEFNVYNTDVVDTFTIEASISGGVTVFEATQPTFSLRSGSEANKVVGEVNYEYPVAHRGMTYVLVQNLPVSALRQDNFDIAFEVYTEADDSDIALEHASDVIEDVSGQFLVLDPIREVGHFAKQTGEIVSFNWQDLAIMKTGQTAVGSPESMLLSRTGAIIAQLNSGTSRAITRSYYPLYDLFVKEVGELSELAEPSHGDYTLAYNGRPNRGPATHSLYFWQNVDCPSRQESEGSGGVEGGGGGEGGSSGFSLGTGLVNEHRVSSEMILMPALYDDAALVHVFNDTKMIKDSWSIYRGIPDGPYIDCITECDSRVLNDANTFCFFEANPALQTRECYSSGDVLDVYGGVVYFFDGSSATLASIDPTDGSVFVVGSSTSVGTFTCSPSPLFDPYAPVSPADPICITSYQTENEPYCDTYCGSGARKTDYVTEFEREVETVLSPFTTSKITEHGFLRLTTPNSGSVTDIVIETLVQMNKASYGGTAGYTSISPVAYDVWTNSLWGFSTDAFIKQILHRPGSDLYDVFIATPSQDFIFRYKLSTKVVVWQTVLVNKMPTIVGAGSRRRSFPSFEANDRYVFLSALGNLIAINLIDGSQEIVGTTGYTNAVIGSQIYSRGNDAVTFVDLSSEKIKRVYAVNKRAAPVRMSAVIEELYHRVGIGLNELNPRDYDNFFIGGIVVENFATAVSEIRELGKLFRMSTVDEKIVDTARTASSIDLLDVLGFTSGDTRKLEKRTWTDNTFKSVTISSLDPDNYEIKRSIEFSAHGETPFELVRTFSFNIALIPGSDYVLAQRFLSTQQDYIKGDLTISVGAKNLNMSVGDNFFVDNATETYTVVHQTTDLLSLATQITARPNLPMDVSIPDILPIRSRPASRYVEPHAVFTTGIPTGHSNFVGGTGTAFYYGARSPFERSSGTGMAFYQMGPRPSSYTSFKENTPSAVYPMHCGFVDAIPMPDTNTPLFTPDRDLVLRLTFFATYSADRIVADAFGVTDTDIINAADRNVVVLPSGEQIQFVTATRIDDHTVDVSTIYRCRNGSEGLLSRTPCRTAVFAYFTPGSFRTMLLNETFFESPDPLIQRSDCIEAWPRIAASGRDWNCWPTFRTSRGMSHHWGPATFQSNRTPNDDGWRISWFPRRAGNPVESTAPEVVSGETFKVRVLGRSNLVEFTPIVDYDFSRFDLSSSVSAGDTMAAYERLTRRYIDIPDSMGTVSSIVPTTFVDIYVAQCSPGGDRTGFWSRVTLDRLDQNPGILLPRLV